MLKNNVKELVLKRCILIQSIKKIINVQKSNASCWQVSDRSENWPVIDLPQLIQYLHWPQILCHLAWHVGSVRTKFGDLIHCRLNAINFGLNDARTLAHWAENSCTGHKTLMCSIV